MLSPKTQTNLKNARSYFEEHLAVGDYYCEGERVRGEWIGNGASVLGLSGTVEKQAFLNLCENRHPRSGKRLTARTKSTRKNKSGADVANRQVFFDFTFSPPKSVSVAALVGNDPRIVTAHHDAVKVAVREMESFAATRVRRAGANSNRITGNVLAALFEHETSRALDPHLHTHCIVFNATLDASEERWKALQNFEMLVAQKYVENVYYHELARGLNRCGYTVVNSARGDFEIAETAPELCARFSKRHQQIDEQTRQFLAEQPSKEGGNVKAIRENLARKTRSRKQHDVSRKQLQALWDSQLTPDEKPGVTNRSDETNQQRLKAADAVDWAEEHLFDRRSIVHEHELWRHALEFARGHRVTLDEIKRETAARPYLREESDKLTRRDVLAREWEIVQMAERGAKKHAPLARNSEDSEGTLADDQRIALRRILGSRDRVTLFRGGAGTGKSYVLRRVQEVLHREGQATHVLAPQRQQVLDLSKDGLTGAQTVAEFLAHGSLDRGAIVIVDEAGQIGARQLYDLLSLIETRGARVILSGDTRQHGPVEASDALRAIERYSGLRPAELNTIRRQDPERARDRAERERIREYRRAVREASQGALETSFDRLQRLGAVTEANPERLREELANAYVELASRGESAIVVSQTWAEIDQVNDRIRRDLHQRGLISGEEKKVVSLRQVDLTSAQKNDPRYYSDDHVVVFNRRVGGCGRGDIGRVRGIVKRGVVIDTGHSLHVVKPEKLDAISVCSPVELKLCSGDRLQLKANAVTCAGAKLANGEIVTVAKIKRTGEITLADGRTLPASYRQFVRGYAVTSYGSQGKTVDHVLLADSGSRAATNAQQWYVSISRGRTSIRIFTPDRAALRRHITRSGDRPLALELAESPDEVRRNYGHALRPMMPGRELTLQLCARRMRAWAASFLNPELKHQNETSHRKANHSRVLAP